MKRHEQNMLNRNLHRDLRQKKNMCVIDKAAVTFEF